MRHVRPIQRLSTLALGALLVFQAAGWYLSWGVLLLDARVRARQTWTQSPDSRLRMVVAVADLPHLRVGNGEIRRSGKLYDVCRETRQGDSIHLELYHDTAEEVLLDRLCTLLTAEEDVSKVHYLWLCQLLEAAYLLPRLPVLPPGPVCLSDPGFSYLLLRAQHAPAHNGPPPRA